MGSLVAGTLTQNTATVSLTIALTDYAIWNGSWAATAVRSGGGATITNPIPTAGAFSMTYTSDPRTVTWTGGSISATGSMNNGIWVSGVVGGSYSTGAGYSLTFPADTTPRNAVLYFGIFSCTTWITATLSDGSAPPLTLTSTAVAASVTSPHVVDFTYAANSPGQTLTIKVTMQVNSGDPFANVALQAAALSLGAVTVTRTFLLLGAGS